MKNADVPDDIHDPGRESEEEGYDHLRAVPVHKLCFDHVRKSPGRMCGAGSLARQP